MSSLTGREQLMSLVCDPQGVHGVLGVVAVPHARFPGAGPFVVEGPALGAEVAKERLAGPSADEAGPIAWRSEPSLVETRTCAGSVT